MAKVAKKSDPKLWEKVKDDVTEGDKGGKPGQWSARKAQLATQEYKQEGGGYEGSKPKDNSLRRWTDQDWGTKSGKKSRETGERYLPKEERKKLSDAEYRRTSEKKRSDLRKGKQFSAQPTDVRRKTSRLRHDGDGRQKDTKAELYAEAKRRDLPGRSTMSKDELRRALKR